MPDVRLAQHFEVGARVGVWPRTGDFWPGADAVGKPAKTVTMDDGVVVRGLDEGRYWAARLDGSGGAVGFVAKDGPAPKRRVAAREVADPQLVPRVLPGSDEIHTGPRGTVVGRRLVESPVGRGQEAHPSLNQASVSASTQQRSATPLGQATPVDPDEPQPHPRQEDVPAKTAQRSDTETGEAEPVGDHVGPQRQEDFRGPQRSATETGEATPIGSAEPRGTDVNPDSRERAEGERPTGGRKPERSGKSDTKGANPEVAAEGRSRPRPAARSRRKS